MTRDEMIEKLARRVAGWHQGERSGRTSTAALIDDLLAALRSRPAPETPIRHGYGCPQDGEDMDSAENCTHCCRHGHVAAVQPRPCPKCYPAPEVWPAPVAPPAETGIDWTLTHERCPQCGDTDQLGGIMALGKEDGSRWCLKCKVRLEAFAR